MQWATLKSGVSAAAGSYEWTVEKQILSKLVIGLRGDATNPTAALLKTSMLNVTFVRDGVLMPLVSASLYDLAMLTDLKGGYGRDWSDTDNSDVNIVIPFGLDMTKDGVLQCSLTIATTLTNTTFDAYSINDGSMPPTLRYRTITTSGTAAFDKALAVFSRNETGTDVSLKVGEDFEKNMPFALGRILFADEAKIEKETIFAKLMSEQYPQKAIFRASAALTLFSIEVP